MSIAKQIIYTKKNKCRFDWLEQFKIHVKGFQALQNRLSVTLRENDPELTPIHFIDEFGNFGFTQNFILQHEYGLYLCLRFYIRDEIYGDLESEFEYGFPGKIETGEYPNGLGWTKFHLDFTDTYNGGIDPKKHMILLFEDEVY